MIGTKGVILVAVDPKALSFDDDMFAVRGVRVQLVPPKAWIGFDQAVVLDDADEPGTLTLDGLVQGLRRDVKATAADGPIRIRLNEVTGLSGRVDIECNRFDA